LDEEKIMTVVNPEKDVEGFHPLNMGNLAMRGMEPLFIPCASKGCIELLLRFGVEIIGKKSVVIGRSKIVGLPTSFLLQVISTFLLIQNIYMSICVIYCWLAEAPRNGQHRTCIHQKPGTDNFSG
jgi:5,10-methylene-tetrahydrofolate dehydrogenase/methenyl tetrahydrofolate cyclohydrolase